MPIAQKSVSEIHARQARFAESCLRLMSNTDFNTFLDEIGNRLLDQRDLNEELKGEDRIIGTGESRALKKLLNDVDNSGLVLTRVRQAEFRRQRGTT